MEPRSPTRRRGPTGRREAPTRPEAGRRAPARAAGRLDASSRPAGGEAQHATSASRGVAPPEELLRRLHVKVLRRLDGYLFGDVSGVFYGPSLDLAEVREYQPGDEVRRIDWHVTARTGVVHVRQYREEREIRGWLIVDRSPSMAFGTRRALKSEVALEFAASAASVLTRQGNKVGALAFGAGGTSIALPASGRAQVLRVLEALQAGARGAGTGDGGNPDPLTGALAHANRTLRRRSLVFVVSDFLARDGGAVTGPGGDAVAGPGWGAGRRAEDGSEPGGDPTWVPELRRLAARHDVIAVRVVDPAERTLPDVGDLRVRDPETGRELWLDTSDRAVRETHARLVRERERALTRWLRSSGADVLELSTAHDIVRPLVAFLRRRRSRRLGVARP